MTGEATPVTVNLSLGSLRRLERICELRGYTDEEAIEMCIAYGWFMAEQKGYLHRSAGGRAIYNEGWKKEW